MTSRKSSQYQSPVTNQQIYNDHLEQYISVKIWSKNACRQAKERFTALMVNSKQSSAKI